MAVQSIAVLNNVSCDFRASTRGRAHLTTTYGVAPASTARRQSLALSTYNRRQETTGMQLGALSSFHGPQLQRITSGRSSFMSPPSLHRLTSHIGQPRFNALARLASTALGSRRTSSDAPGISASAAVAARPQQPKSMPAPSQQIPGAAQTPFAQPAQAPSQSSFQRDLDSELGFPTDFRSRYTLGYEMGAGSFGKVYAAVDNDTGDAVAVKMLPKEPATPGRRPRGGNRAAREKMLGKVKQELDVLQRLQLSGNAVELLGTFEDRTNIYIVMEQCTGGDLDYLLEERGPLQEADVAHIMYEVLELVASCHKNNIFHGDIKPANFMLKHEPKSGARTLGFDKLKTGWLKAIDFGCAQHVPDGGTLTRKTGTPMFMAPEVFLGNYGLEADCWAAGMMMYQLLAERFPWWKSIDELHTTTLEQVMQAVIQKVIPLNYGPFRQLSKEGLELISGLLNRNAAERLTAEQALEHPWFQRHGLGVKPVERSNIVPLGRRLSDSMRLRMSAAELTRAQSRPATGLSGLLDDMMSMHDDFVPAGSTALMATLC